MCRFVLSQGGVAIGREEGDNGRKAIDIARAYYEDCHGLSIIDYT